MYVAAVPLIWDESCLKTCAADTKNFGRYIKQALAISSTGSHFQAVMQKVFQGLSGTMSRDAVNRPRGRR